jgi:hypothetical protein
LFEEWADPAAGDPDGGRGDVEQLGQYLAGAHLALVEHRYQDTFRVGDLFKEHTPAGSG